MTRRPRHIDVAGWLGVCFIGVFLVVSEIATQLDWAPRGWSTPDFPEIGAAIIGAAGAALATGLLALLLRSRRSGSAAGSSHGAHGRTARRRSA